MGLINQSAKHFSLLTCLFFFFVKVFSTSSIWSFYNLTNLDFSEND